MTRRAFCQDRQIFLCILLRTRVPFLNSLKNSWHVQTVVAGHDAETGAGFSEDFIFPLFTRDPAGLQLHLVERDLTANIRNGQVINPIHGPGLGHIAFRVDNLAAFREHLNRLGIPYSDYGEPMCFIQRLLFSWQIQMHRSNSTAPV